MLFRHILLTTVLWQKKLVNAFLCLSNFSIAQTLDKLLRISHFTFVYSKTMTARNKSLHLRTSLFLESFLSHFPRSITEAQQMSLLNHNFKCRCIRSHVIS